MLEALATTDISLLFDVDLNKEVVRESRLYFNESNLADLINNEDSIVLKSNPKDEIKNGFYWKLIIDAYETVFSEG